MDYLAVIVYGDSRMDFEIYRDKIMNKAQAAHDRGDEDEAQKLLNEVGKLRYTGLMWRQDNGLEDN